MANIKPFFKGVKTLVTKPTHNKHVAKAILSTRKHAPEILVYSGVVGMVGSSLLACRDIFEANQIHLKADGDRIRMKKYVEINPESEEAKTYRKDLTMSYLKETGQIAKAMAPALTLAGLSITAILAGHNMLSKRHVAVVAAYTTLQNSYDEYREAVREAIGEEAEEDIRRGIVEKSAEKELDPEKPLSKQVRPNGYSPWAAIFDETNPNFERDNTYNKWFLHRQEKTLTDLLKSRGYVTLNEAYEALGMAKTATGFTHGWVLGRGDDRVDFGIYADTDNEQRKAFINGFENAVWLDFNVDGYIYDDLQKILGE